MATTLLCEDDEDIRLLVTLLLEASGRTVTSTSDVAGALAALEEGDYELVLTDLGLPDGDGSTVCASAVQAGCRVIVLTARDSAATDPELRAVSHQVLAKPFTPGDLLGALG